VIDETEELKKGSQSVGVQRQYTATAGRIENQGSVKVAVCTKCPSIAYHGNLAPALDRRGCVASAHDVGAVGRMGRIATLTGPCIENAQVAVYLVYGNAGAAAIRPERDAHTTSDAKGKCGGEFYTRPYPSGSSPRSRRKSSGRAPSSSMSRNMDSGAPMLR
jgi:hypothetical protein